MFNDWSARFTLVPPYITLDLGVRTYVFSHCHHNGLASGLDNVLHVLDDLEISEHVAYTGYCARLLEVMSEIDSVLNWCRSDWLLDEQRGLREELENLDFHISARPS